MLSSISAAGGVNSAYVLQLFAVSEVDDSAATTTGRTPATSIATSAGANAPLKTIQALATQVQMERAPQAVQGALSSSQLAEIGYTAQQENVLIGELNAREASAPPPPAAAAQGDDSGLYTTASVKTDTLDHSVQTSQTTTRTTAGGEIAAFSSDDHYASDLNGVAFSTSMSATSAADPNNPQQWLDSFTASVGMGDDKVTVGFSVAGLGLIHEPTQASGAISVGNGPLTDFFQVGLGAEGQYGAIAFNVTGLNAAQAQQLGEAFKSAVPASATASESGNSFSYLENVGSGGKADIDGIVGY